MNCCIWKNSWPCKSWVFAMFICFRSWRKDLSLSLSLSLPLCLPPLSSLSCQIPLSFWLFHDGFSQDPSSSANCMPHNICGTYIQVIWFYTSVKHTACRIIADMNYKTKSWQTGKAPKFFPEPPINKILGVLQQGSHQLMKGSLMTSNWLHEASVHATNLQSQNSQ